MRAVTRHDAAAARCAVSAEPDGAVGEAARAGSRRADRRTARSLFAVIYVDPFLIQVATSFKTNADAVANPLRLIPDPFTIGAWKQLARDRLPALVHSTRVVVTLSASRSGRVLLRLDGRVRAGPAALPRPRRTSSPRSSP